MATILIVDDSPVNRRYLTTLLSHEQHQLIEANDGGDVLAAVRSHRPDVIVADVMMPVDAYEMMRQLRGDPGTKDVPVVIFTAHYGARSLALSSGAAWFLTNAEAAELNPAIERVLAGERQQVEAGAERSSG